MQVSKWRVWNLFKLGQWNARGFFWLNGLYAAVLMAMLIGRQAHWLYVDRIADPIGGLIPIGVPWFGALGALLISAYGVFDHNTQWDRKWNYWHAARPMVGAVLGVVAFMIFVGLINATGSDTQIEPSADRPSSGVAYLVLAFVVGFREETFRMLIKRAVDILLGPGIPGDTPQSVVLACEPRSLGTMKVGTPVTVTVTAINAGTAAVSTNAATASPAGLVATGAATIAVDGLDGVTLPAGGVGTGTVTVTPTKAGAVSINIEVSGTFGKRSIIVHGDADD
jgi:hypothetical protein